MPGLSKKATDNGPGAAGASLLERFKQAGYADVAPPILQPADVFFNWSGEEIRRRSFVFTALNGEELCLRPDLTIPVCRLHLEEGGNGRKPARYCYLGPAFRYRPDGESDSSPREFEQAGIEHFGEEDREAAEAEVFGVALYALRAEGLGGATVRFGDLGLFSALVEGLDVPARWRAHLRRGFQRPRVFHDLLHGLGGDGRAPGDDAAAALLRSLAGVDMPAATRLVEEALRARDIPVSGLRGIGEIAERLVEQAADLDAAPLDRGVVRLIDAFISIKAAPRAALDRIAALQDAPARAMAPALEAFCRRLDLIEQRGCTLDDVQFATEFGRNMDYYTGFVFQIEKPALGPAGRIAGGGRYDTLLAALGAGGTVPAVGCAIDVNRLARARREGAS